ncbi:hypothetical protein [Acuticoccus sp.]|uniref:hypothetical protein n=1 Tax=Acuticoccus sp. TaxID=1904378 RepID=UPI003B52D270
MQASLPVVLDGTPHREGRWHLVLKLDEKEVVRPLRSLPSQLDGRLVQGVRPSHGMSRVERPRERGVDYSALVQTVSNLTMRTTLTRSSFEPGATMRLETVITEYGGPFRGASTIAADVTTPSGAVVTVRSLPSARDATSPHCRPTRRGCTPGACGRAARPRAGDRSPARRCAPPRCGRAATGRATTPDLTGPARRAAAIP